MRYNFVHIHVNKLTALNVYLIAHMHGWCCIKFTLEFTPMNIAKMTKFLGTLSTLGIERRSKG